MRNRYVIILTALCLQCIATVANVASAQVLCAPDTTDGIIHRREVYKSVDTFNLKIDIFYQVNKTGKGNRPAIVFFHGGGWAYGKPDEFFTTCQRYARLGYVTFSVDYRLSNRNGEVPVKGITPVECVMDARSAMRFVRKNAERLYIDTNRIVAAGQSAGGQLALSTAMIDRYNEKSDDANISCRPDAIILFSSCINTLEGWCDHLLGDRREQIWSISPFHHVKPGLPPMIEFHGTYDDQVPAWTARYFANEMEKAGNYFELHLYEGKRHYLGEGNAKYSNYYNEDVLELTDKFLGKFVNR